MNVLIYDGPGTSQAARSGAHASLTALLSPYYSVRYISPASLISEPWSPETALLVVPGGRDLPYCSALDGPGTQKIDAYVRRGGKYLGLCAGAYFASKRVEFEVGTEMEISGSRELGFFQGTARGGAYTGFVYDSEEGARVVKVSVESAMRLGAALGDLDLNGSANQSTIKDDQADEPNSTDLSIYWNGGGVFVDAEKTAGVEVLARYKGQVKVEGGNAAVVSMRHSQGQVVLSAVHPEMSTDSLRGRRKAPQSRSPSDSPTQNLGKSTILDPSASAFIPVAEQEAEAAGQMYIQKTRSSSSVPVEGLDSAVPSPSNSPTQETMPKPLNPAVNSFTPASEIRQMQAAHLKDRMTLLRIILERLGLKTNEKLEKPPELSTLHLLTYAERGRPPLLDIFKSLVTQQKDNIGHIKSDHDTFGILIHASKRPATIEDDNVSHEDQIKYISVDRHPPEFPLFDARRFFVLLHRLHYTSQTPATAYKDPLFGTLLLYGETVTSSQSLLDKNFSLQRQLPSGFTILCSHQLAGRGRGQNSWISPAGVLSFSSILHHTPVSGESASSVVLIQYLVSLVVAEAILALRTKLNVRIKWPNDIYLEIPETMQTSGPSFAIEGKKYAKISGSLITSSWYGGKYIMTIGIGINVSNPHPTISINGVLPEVEGIALEELFAQVLVTLANHYTRFVDAGASFAPFEKRYYELWLHNEQKVKIEATQETGTVAGINLTDGTLRVSTPRGEVGLQADGNSFDMMEGLLKVKT